VLIAFVAEHVFCRQYEIRMPLAQAQSFPLCCLLFGSQRLTEANEGNEEEIPSPKNFVLRLPSTFDTHVIYLLRLAEMSSPARAVKIA
jgi:hypothetical protein